MRRFPLPFAADLAGLRSLSTGNYLLLMGPDEPTGTVPFATWALMKQLVEEWGWVRGCWSGGPDQGLGRSVPSGGACCHGAVRGKEHLLQRAQEGAWCCSFRASP